MPHKAVKAAGAFKRRNDGGNRNIAQLLAADVGKKPERVLKKGPEGLEMQDGAAFGEHRPNLRPSSLARDLPTNLC